jgi:hypothetical protein
MGLDKCPTISRFLNSKVVGPASSQTGTSQPNRLGAPWGQLADLTQCRDSLVVDETGEEVMMEEDLDRNWTA